MKIHRDLNKLPDFRNAVLTIGTYDGVHFGHQQIIRRIIELAKELGGESVLMTFDPHPRLVLQPDQELKLITTIDEKLKLLKNYDLDHIVVIPFSKDFAAMDARDYIKDVLVKYIHPKKIVIGYDHKYGKGRSGDIDLLKATGPDYGYEVEEISKQTIDEITVSSTKVRNALLHGDIITANQWMAHPFSMAGKVVHGDKIGRTLGFPTANIEVSDNHKLIPPEGVYAVKVKLDDELYNAALSIGRRPTFKLGEKLMIEAYIFDFAKDVYGKEIEIIFVGKIRDQVKFENSEDLIIQMKIDVIDCKKALYHSS